MFVVISEQEPLKYKKYYKLKKLIECDNSSYFNFATTRLIPSFIIF